MNNYLAIKNAVHSSLLYVTGSEIQFEDQRLEDLGLDSLDTVELLMEIEKKLDIHVPDDEYERIFTPNSTIASIISNLENFKSRSSLSY